jgi:hypothetical protein
MESSVPSAKLVGLDQLARAVILVMRMQLAVIVFQAITKMGCNVYLALLSIPIVINV